MDSETVAAALDAEEWSITDIDAPVPKGTDWYISDENDTLRFAENLVQGKHHATVAELCRQQHDAIKGLLRWIVLNAMGEDDELIPEEFLKGHEMVALWPDDAEDDQNEGD